MAACSTCQGTGEIAVQVTRNGQRVWVTVPCPKGC